MDCSYTRRIDKNKKIHKNKRIQLQQEQRNSEEREQKKKPREIKFPVEWYKTEGRGCYLRYATCEVPIYQLDITINTYGIW